jgi:P27 family predicted phage terminase small subunit
MGARGPAPKPTKLRVLHGETRPSRINADEPQPAKMEPTPPEWLNAKALVVWERTVYQLRVMSMLTAADGDALAVYCQSVVNYEEAVRLVNAAGYIIRGRDGNPVKNPAVQMVRDFGAQVRVMAGEFGLTPAARVGLSTKGSPSAGAGAERYLSG